MEWKVNLSGDSYLLQCLSSNIIQTGELKIFEDDGHFYLTNKEFENLTSVDEVRNLAKEIIEMINGISFLLFGKKGTIFSNSISKQNDVGGYNQFVFPETVILNLTVNQPSNSSTNEDGSLSYSSPLSLTQNLLLSAKTNSKKATIFRLLSSGNIDWVSLYRLYEVIYSDIGDQIFSWTNKNTIKNFKHTCNSISAIGDDCRHGLEKENPPKNPMSLIEAQNLIKLIINKYLEIK